MDVGTTPEGSDNEVTLDSALEAAWSTDEIEGEDPVVDEQVDDDEVDDDAEVEVEDEESDTEDTDAEEEIESEEQDDSERFTVKIDGEEVEVTREELLGGYMRQADYTRKTQAVSSEKEKYAAFEALEVALRDAPQETLVKLARLYGVDLAGSQDNPVEDPLDDLDPALATEIRQMRQFTEEFRVDRERQAAAERSAQIDSEIQAVRVKYDDSSLESVEGQEALLRFAVDNGIQNLDAAYKALAFEKAQAEKASTKTKTVARKRKAPPVEGGRNRSKGVTKGVDPSEMTIEDAWDIAVAEHA